MLRFVTVFCIINYLCVVDVDYEKQRYSVIFEEGGKTYSYLETKRKSDDRVEADEDYFLEIETATLHERVAAVKPSTTKIILVNDDGR